eukprot:TRINITY_DN6690_c0_g1_i3.p1 TRINITY_DN6690_c0_g1~~TRINITY_DN6690_c0_g1_i3.p1  ORF type:complete len:310 (-),score=69.97 TRINITY_DN6690_c0_g1_i3:69-998(-)
MNDPNDELHDEDPKNFIEYMNAIKNNRIKVIRRSSKFSTFPFELEGQKFTPLHYVSHKNMLEMIEALVLGDSHVDPNIVVPGTFITPLHCAASSDSLAAVQSLIKLGAQINPDESTSDGWTALHAAAGSSLEVTKFLLKKGAKVNVKNKEGLTPLHVACTSGGSGIIDILLYNKADKNACNDMGVTPLHLACTSGSYYSVDSLLSWSPDVNAIIPSSKLTPLHFAAQVGRKEIIRLLVNKKADIKSIDSEGRTPADLACNERIAKFIREGAPGSGFKLKKDLFPLVFMIAPILLLYPVFFEVPWLSSAQ